MSTDNMPMIRTAQWLLTLLLLAACTGVRAAPLPYVDLSVRTPLPVAANQEIKPLRMAVAAIMSPTGTAESHQHLANYLAERLGRPVEMMQRRTYQEVNQLVADGMVDLAFICTSAYVDGSAKEIMDLLVAPQIDGKTEYRSQIIVRDASDIHTLEDLAGRPFAFTDPMSFTGRVYPSYLLSQLGATPGDFFDRTFFTYSHDRAIDAVAAGIADGAAVDSLVLRFALTRSPELREQVRIIHTSPPFGIPPVVVPADFPARQRAVLAEILLTMHLDAAGQAVLQELGAERFVPPDDSAYDEVRRLVAATTISP